MTTRHPAPRILETVTLGSLPTSAEMRRIEIVVSLDERRRSAAGRPRLLVAIAAEYERLGMLDTANEVYREAGSRKRARPMEKPKRLTLRGRRDGPHPETLAKLRTAKRLIANGATKAAASRAVGIAPTNFKRLEDKYGRLVEAA